FSTLKVALGGGMPVQKAVADRWKKMTGCTLIEAYGLSETSPAVTINPLDLKDYNGSIGLPISSTEVILRRDDGEDAPLGAPGEHSGEVPKLFVVKRDASLTEADIRAHCAANLTGYKRPKTIEFRKELPKTNVGKILRRALREEAKT